MASLVASASAMYSASHEYNATVDCSVLMKTDTISDEGVPAAGIADWAVATIRVQTIYVLFTFVLYRRVISCINFSDTLSFDMYKCIQFQL